MFLTSCLLADTRLFNLQRRILFQSDQLMGQSNLTPCCYVALPVLPSPSVIVGFQGEKMKLAMLSLFPSIVFIAIQVSASGSSVNTDL